MKPDKIFFSLAFVIILTTISWITSCTHKADTTGIPAVCFNNVMAILSGKCSTSGCHDGTGESGLDLTDPIAIINSVVPFKPDASPLYKAITSVRGETKMPPDQPISQESRTTIRIWIEQGALDNRGDTNVCPPDSAKAINSDNDMSNNK